MADEQRFIDAEEVCDALRSIKSNDIQVHLLCIVHMFKLIKCSDELISNS